MKSDNPVDVLEVLHNGDVWLVERFQPESGENIGQGSGSDNQEDSLWRVGYKLEDGELKSAPVLGGAQDIKWQFLAVYRPCPGEEEENNTDFPTPEEITITLHQGCWRIWQYWIMGTHGVNMSFFNGFKLGGQTHIIIISDGFLFARPEHVRQFGAADPNNKYLSREEGVGHEVIFSLDIAAHGWIVDVYPQAQLDVISTSLADHIRAGNNSTFDDVTYWGVTWTRTKKPPRATADQFVWERLEQGSERLTNLYKPNYPSSPWIDPPTLDDLKAMDFGGCVE